MGELNLEIYAWKQRAMESGRPYQTRLGPPAEILSNVVDGHAISGEYPGNGHERLLRFQITL